MAKYALIKGNNVEAVIDPIQPKEYYTDICHLLIDAPDEVQCNWSYINGKFISPEGEIVNKKTSLFSKIIKALGF